MPDEIQRLVRVAARKGGDENYVGARFRVLRAFYDKFRRIACEDGISPNAVIEAAIVGYVNRHPGVLAVVDQYIRDNAQGKPERKVPRLSRHDLDEIYAAAGSGMIEEEE